MKMTDYLSHARDIEAQFPATPEGMKTLAKRCAWAEVRLAQLLTEKEKAEKEKAAKN